MHKIIANIASIAHVASGVLDNSIAIAIAHIARSERGLRDCVVFSSNYLIVSRYAF